VCVRVDTVGTHVLYEAWILWSYIPEAEVEDDGLPQHIMTVAPCHFIIIVIL